MKKKTNKTWFKSIRIQKVSNLSWPQAKKRFPLMKPYGDADKDGVKNFLDCKPFDRMRQGEEHDDGKGDGRVTATEDIRRCPNCGGIMATSKYNDKSSKSKSKKKSKDDDDDEDEPPAKKKSPFKSTKETLGTTRMIECAKAMNSIKKSKDVDAIAEIADKAFVKAGGAINVKQSKNIIKVLLPAAEEWGVVVNKEGKLSNP